MPERHRGTAAPRQQGDLTAVEGPSTEVATASSANDVGPVTARREPLAGHGIGSVG